ncbi:PASTA domain-containing protein [Fructilactobacillus frigidiflavus]
MYVTMKQPQNITIPTTKVMGDNFNVVMKKALQNNLAKVKTPKIPKVVGDPLSEAQNKLNAKKIQSVVIGKGNSVVKQNPAADAPKDLSPRVMLLTDGRMTMPDLTGWSRDEIEDFASLTNIKVTFDGEGNATEQSIKPNDEFDENTQLEVKLTN